MGTRSLTSIKDERDKEIVVLYRQFDGYPTGHGQELKDFLTGIVLVNGLGSGQPPQVANGMGCLAAQVVAHFKTRPGDFYLYPANTRDCGEEYIYEVTGRVGSELYLRVTGPCSNKVLFDGPISKFNPKRAESQESF